jgi:hypothetical protein
MLAESLFLAASNHQTNLRISASPDSGLLHANPLEPRAVLGMPNVESIDLDVSTEH